MGAPQQALLMLDAAASYTYSAWDVSSLPANVVASESNFRLARSGGGSATRAVYHPVTRTTGKYSVRLRIGDNTSSGASTGVAGILTGSIGSYLGASANGIGFWPNDLALDRAYRNGTAITIANPGENWGSTLADEVQLEIDLTNLKLWIGVNGAYPSSGDPASGANPTYTLPSGQTWSLVADMYYNTCDVRLCIPSQFRVSTVSGFTPGWPD